MNIINEQYGIVTPIRCGTRWIWENILLQLNQPRSTAVHSFNLSSIENRKVIFVSRNPYTKLRSIFRWYKTIKYIPVNQSWEDFIMSSLFEKEALTFHEQYGDRLDIIDTVVKLENIHQDIYNILNLNLPPYNNSYFDSQSDDGLTLEQAYENVDILQKVNSKFEKDFKRFGYEKFDF